MPRLMKRRESVLKNSYNQEIIHMERFVFYEDVINSWGKVQEWSHSMNGDSIFEIFDSSLQKLDLKLERSSVVKNNFESSFRKNWAKRFDKSIIEKVLLMAGRDEKLYLVPLIKITHSYESGMYSTSSGSVGGSRYLMQNNLYLIIYLIKGNSIVYARSGFFLDAFYPAYDVMDIQHTLTQKDWDELVALVMKDYIDRIRE
jgi:hypothetical protein